MIADTSPYDGETWSALREQTHLRLALDCFHVDHPVGQFGVRPGCECGTRQPAMWLFTHVLYEREAFIEMIRGDGSRLLAPEGTGIGFVNLLEQLPWRRLA